MLKIEMHFETAEEAVAALQAVTAIRQRYTAPAASLTPSAPTASAMIPATPSTPAAPQTTVTPVVLGAAASEPLTATPNTSPTPVTPPVVPTAAAPAYNRDQIMTAGAALIDAGKIAELTGLLNAFGVQAVTQLKQEQLGAFATELRKLGAQI